MKPTITICSDASLSHRHRVATWACFIQGAGITIQTGGVLKEYTNRSSEAERQGIANALWLLAKCINLSGHHLVVYCDNLDALNPEISEKGKPLEAKKSALKMNMIFRQQILPFLEMAESYVLLHVKGHLPESQWTARRESHHMNRWCDGEARRLLQEAVKERQEKLDGSAQAASDREPVL